MNGNGTRSDVLRLAGVVRAGRFYRVDAPEVDPVEAGDVLLYVRKVTPANAE